MLVPASGFTCPAVEAEADKALAERDPVTAAVDLFDRGMYFQCNFEPDTEVESAPCQVLMSVKAARPGSQDVHKHNVDKLVLLEAGHTDGAVCAKRNISPHVAHCIMLIALPSSVIEFMDTSLTDIYS